MVQLGAYLTPWGVALCKIRHNCSVGWANRRDHTVNDKCAGSRAVLESIEQVRASERAISLYQGMRRSASASVARLWRHQSNRAPNTKQF